jgi:hypothetical protein
LPAAAQEVVFECCCKIEALQESLISYAGPKVRKGSKFPVQERVLAAPTPDPLDSINSLSYRRR